VQSRANVSEQVDVPSPDGVTIGGAAPLRGTRGFLPFSPEMLRQYENFWAENVENITRITAPFKDEYEAWPDDWYFNMWFDTGDAELYYSMIRTYKPNRIIEIGSGYCTRIAAEACRVNEKGLITCIDPIPRTDLPSIVSFEKALVQDVDLALFETLGEGDFLFIDSSHGMREAIYHYLILDRLAPGVIVHHHDFYFPLVPLWPEEDVIINYYLAHADAWEGVAGNADARHKLGPEGFAKLFSHYTGPAQSYRYPGSIYTRKRARYAGRHDYHALLEDYKAANPYIVRLEEDEQEMRQGYMAAGDYARKLETEHAALRREYENVSEYAHAIEAEQATLLQKYAAAGEYVKKIEADHEALRREYDNVCRYAHHLEEERARHIEQARMLADVTKNYEAFWKSDIANIRRICLPFKDEYESWPHDWYYNGWFQSGDAELYYAMIRTYQPERIIEIGSGYCTRVAAEACRVNGKGRITCIDPEPRRGLPEIVTFKKAMVQDVDLALFETLKENDILFIDSSHGTEEAIYHHKILDRVAPGVIVHHHDFYFPLLSEWPEENIIIAYYMDRIGQWEGLVSNADVRHKLGAQEYSALFANYAEIPDRYPGSIYTRRLATHEAGRKK
jgi:predicted O-methyltransferase YrrM